MIQDDYNRHAPSRSKLLGACHGLSELTGLNATFVRAGAVVLLCVWFKLTIIAYCAAAVAFRLRQR
jgi:phage shock protein PspC (stress-responsive transcriptional regulator)